MKTTEELIKNLKKRNPESHKGDYGKDLVIAGSELMTGAAILSSKAAMRTGAGLVYVACTKEMVETIHIAFPEAVCVLRDSLDFSKYDAVLIGPGMGKGKDTEELLKRVLSEYNGPVVIDADAVNVIPEYDLYDYVKGYSGDLIFTPHSMEAERLLKKHEERSAMAEELVKLTGATICLKGHRTIVKNTDSEYINETGNPGMATAGSGDVLSGIILALLGEGIPSFDAAALGVYIHGLSGDSAKDILGEDGLIASDIINQIPLTIKKLKEK